jgi:hypothetical protein
MTASSPTKRIPKSLNTEAKLLGRYTLADAAVALLPGVVVVLLTQVLLPTSLRIGGYRVQSLTLPIALVAIGFGVVFVTLTPSYTNSLDWLQTVTGFYASSTDHELDEASEYTQIERVHPDRDAIERIDGAFIGLVQVDPPNMALATDEQWAQKADAFQDFLNTTVEFPIQIFSTTQAFPAEAYLGHYESRLSDPDVKANPQLQALIEHYVEWYAADLEQRQMTIRDHYIVVSVTPEAVQFERDSVVWKLARIPVLGTIVRLWRGPSLEEQHEAMFDLLSQRLRRVERGIREIEGCGAHRVPVAEATERIASFWEGEEIEYGDTGQVFRRTPIIRGGQ